MFLLLSIIMENNNFLVYDNGGSVRGRGCAPENRSSFYIQLFLEQHSFIIVNKI